MVGKKGGESMMARNETSRLVSLDVLRGLTVVGMIVVNSMSALHYGKDIHVFPLLLHAEWNGLTFADLVFPAFLMMVGVAIPLASRNVWQSGSVAAHKPAFMQAQMALIMARTARLFLLGLFLSNLYWMIDFDARSWRLFGVLQRIALVYCACALLYPLVSPRMRIGLIIAILIFYWPLSLWPALDGLPNDILLRGHNFVASVDRVLLGAGNHIFVTGPSGYDPEGLLGTLPAIAHGLIGVAIGEYLLNRPAQSARTLALMGASMLATGVTWSMFFPSIKDIWSSSFVLITCGITTCILAIFHYWIDRGGEKNVATRHFIGFGTAFGINAIAAYTLHQLSGEVPTWDVLMAPFHWLQPKIGEGWAAFAPVLIYSAIMWACMAYLQRRRWIIKI